MSDQVLQKCSSEHREDEGVLRQVLQAIQSIQYGSVEVTIQDGKVVQIERKEKVRFGQESSLRRR